ncbi:MAG: DNA topoisomerase [Nanoarchaeota archaeon]|nr:DNA topoisomerase [Nanoarchaeota archaeon]
MPKKPKKSKEERIAENYFPVYKEDLKRTIEKEYKEIDPKSLEKIEEVKQIKTKRKYSRKKSSKNKTSPKKRKTIEKKFIPPKISLKPNGYEFIITEKPQAALKIASALGKSIQKDINKIPYYEVNRQGKKIIVGCAVGHLFTLKQNESGFQIPIFNISWTPNYLVKKNDFTKRYYDALLKLAKDAGNLTVATDYDTEGEVIGLNVVRFICGQKDANRMKFSTLTEKELNESYENKSSRIDWGQAIAGETRHYLDWFYGINLSRALMNAIKSTGNFRIMSIGRVQGPALNLIVKKEREIGKFISKPFWQVFINVSDGKNKVELRYHKDIFDKKELEKFNNLVGKTAKAQTKKTEQIIPPNPPFNLTTLQTEAYKFHGITPSETLRFAQSLYLAGLISYRRTSSQKLPASIDYQTILKKLAREYNVEKLITKTKPIEGKKSDPAHPSIYPTGNTQILAGQEEKIYNLIVKRFLSLFCDNAIIHKKTVKAEVEINAEKILKLSQQKGEGEGQKNSVSEIGGKAITQEKLIFTANGASIKKKNWMEIYPFKLQEKEIPDLEGDVKIIDLKTEEKKTQPPKRYSPASIVSELEKRNLGTKATRSSILETLYDRGYIKEKSIEATSLGMSLISTLEKYSPIIIDEKLTRTFENEMEDIQKSKKDFEKKKEKVINEAKETIRKISEDFEKKEDKIGKELLQANNELIEKQKEENKLTICPVCKKGYLAITYSKKTRRYFVACNAYPECKTTYSLPPNGLIKKTDKICEGCGFPMLMLLKKGRKPWIFCFNRECPTNKKRIEEYRKRQEQQ